MARCVTCGTELHPDRALKYDYCTAPACQERNLKGVTMVAIGLNKAAEEFMILDEDTRADLASGKYRDQCRGSFGPPAPPDGPRPPVGQLRPAGRPARLRPAAQVPARPRWTASQE
ncbi:MAG TPA: hypothetical protein VH520_04470, partial [Streptosporangiaceae bacterium]